MLDHIDERPLSPAEIRELCLVLFGQAAASLPDPNADRAGFLSAIDALQKQFPEPHNLLTVNTSPWIRTDVLAQVLDGTYKPQSPTSCCVQ